jgi:hypothetical protein
MQKALLTARVSLKITPDETPPVAQSAVLYVAVFAVA